MGRATRWLKGLFGMKKDRDRSYSGDRKDKSMSSCVGRSRREPSNSPVGGASWLKSVYNDHSEEEQNKHAIAVAAATAAAADAAVAAAHAAVAMVRLTSQGRPSIVVAAGSRENCAAVKIQSAFRAFLARKALRALKALVKLQALVRGYLVRKQAAATLHSMEALVRAQSNVRAQKTCGTINRQGDRSCSQFRHRRSMERINETKSEYTKSVHSRRLSVSFETDESPKIVEVDPGRPKTRSRRTKTWAWAPESGDSQYAQTLLSPDPKRFSIPSSRNLREFEWAPIAEDCPLSTAQSTPRFANSFGPIACGSVTPLVTSCSDGPFAVHPNYMSNTKSFRAKLRSYSAPRQRPDFGFRPKNRVSIAEMMESRNSISCGVRMQRSNSQAKEVSSFKNAVVDRLGRSSEVSW